MITIFTPIFNRAYIIENLYNSLLCQTCFDFEWLIVDDGSDDGIEELVRKWQCNTQKFAIRFYRQKNGGKHRAINYGVKLARYDAFFIVDSDDYLENDAVELIVRNWDDIRSNHEIAGMAGLKKYPNGEIIGGACSFDGFVDATNLERGIYGLKGDKAEIYKTEILRRFPFPEYENENFVTEAVVWDRIACEGYKVRWVNHSFMICNYLNDGLTAKGKQIFVDNPIGWAYYIRQSRKYGILKNKDFLRQCYSYYEYEHLKFNDYELEELLGLSGEERLLIAEQYNGFLRILFDLCLDRKVCIYAYGQWGKRLRRYFDCLDIKVEYVIDQKYSTIDEMKAYSIEMDLPHTDIVFVALKEERGEVKETIRKKMPEAVVIMCRDIKPELW